MFAEADETRFLIQEPNQIRIFSIDTSKIDKNEDDEDGQDEEDVKIIISPIWESQKLHKEMQLNRTKSKHEWFSAQSQFHSSISILSKIDKLKFKDVNQIEEFFFFFDDYHIYMFFKKPRQPDQLPFVVFEDEMI